MSCQEQLIVSGCWGCEVKYVLFVICVACCHHLQLRDFSIDLSGESLGLTVLNPECLSDIYKSEQIYYMQTMTPKVYSSHTGHIKLVVVFMLSSNLYL